MARVNINVDKELLEEIDKRAKKLHISRSAYISLSCSTYNRALDTLDNHITNLDEELSEALRKRSEE